MLGRRESCHLYRRCGEPISSRSKLGVATPGPAGIYRQALHTRCFKKLLMPGCDDELSALLTPVKITDHMVEFLHLSLVITRHTVPVVDPRSHMHAATGLPHVEVNPGTCLQAHKVALWASSLRGWIHEC